MTARQLLAAWPFLLVLLSCYVCWMLCLVWLYPLLGWPALLAVAYIATLHSSLQHETVHGHPSRLRWLNELLVFPPLGLLYPYRRYRLYHLKHHIDSRLTDPLEDPESWYLSSQSWSETSALMRKLLWLNSTLAGRMTIGPALVVAGLLRSESKLILAGEQGVLFDWLSHAAGVAVVLIIVHTLGVSPWLYVALVAYPGMSLLLLRSFIEHKAEESVPGRTAVIEAGWVMSLLFLNNNLHAVHHRNPSMAWHKLPKQWRREKLDILQKNGSYHYPGGYWQVSKAWLLRAREPLKHPFLRCDPVSKDPSVSDSLNE